MRRRQFIAGLGSAAAWPVAARSQQSRKVWRVGFLGPLSASAHASRIEAIRLGMRDYGYIEGANLIVEYRWADGHYERLPDLAADLVRSNVEVIITYTTPASLAAKRTTTTIPIVMVMIGDPVRAGFVASLARPGGNMTGYSEISPDLIGKRLALLKECVPALARVAFLWNPDNPSNRAIREALMGAIPTLGLQLISVPIRDANEFDGAFSAMMRGMPNAAVATNDPMIRRNMRRIIDFAATNRLPVIYQTKEFVAAGGLMSYGTDEPSMFRRGASYVHRILQGAKPADLPIEQPTRFGLTLNLKTAKALGLTIPETLLATADEVIQ